MSLRRRSSRVSVLVVVCGVALLAACAPPPTGVPRSSISGVITPDEDWLYFVNYFSPEICAPAGTPVLVRVSGTVDLVGVKLLAPGEEPTSSDVVQIWDRVGSAELTSTTECFSVWIHHGSFGGLGGASLHFRISWPTPPAPPPPG